MKHQYIAKTYKNDNGENIPGLSVYQHCYIVGLVSETLIDNYYVEFKNITGIPLLCALHDIGKISPYFQHMILSNLDDSSYVNKFIKEYTYDCDAIDYCTLHEKISRCHLSNYIDNSNEYSKALDIIELHHGSYRSKNRFEFTLSELGDGKWVNDRDELCKDLEYTFGTELPSDSIIKNNWEYILAILCISDWIASDDTHFNPTISKLPTGPSDIKPSLIIQLKHKIHSIINDNGLSRVIDYKPDQTFKNMFGFKPYPLQNLLIDTIDGDGVYILEAPMGKGKTEAALYAAYKLINKGLANGLFFGLPTQMTSNSIYSRIEQAFDSPTALIHSNSKVSISKIDRTHCISSWMASSNKRSIFNPIGVGTVDQALLGVLSSVKHFFLRKLGIYNKVIILDEIHSYDAYTGSIIQELIKQNNIIIILSATLTANSKRELLGIKKVSKSRLKSRGQFKQYTGIEKLNDNAYPLVTTLKNNCIDTYTVTNEQSQIKYNINIHNNVPVTTDLDKAIELVNMGYKVLWFDNIVSEAQMAYKYACTKLSSDQVILLHSAYTINDRRNHEAECFNKYGKGSTWNGGHLLITTQVAEQSVDIDADIMYTMLCPMDMLLQRLGRIWRHPKENRICKEANVIIRVGELSNKLNNPTYIKVDMLRRFVNKFGSKTPYIYEPYILLKTLDELSKWKSISIPADIRILLENTYKVNGKYTIWCDIMNQHKIHAVTSANNMMSDNITHRGINSDLETVEVLPSTRLIRNETTSVYLISNENMLHLDNIDEYEIKVSLHKLPNSVHIDESYKMQSYVLYDGINILEFDGTPSGTTYQSDVGLIYNKKTN